MEEGVGDVVFFEDFFSGVGAEVVFRAGETEEVVGVLMIVLQEEGDFAVFILGQVEGLEW